MKTTAGWFDTGRAARWVGLLCAAIFTVLALRQVDLRQVIAPAVAPNAWYLGLALALALGNIPLKALRWRLLIAPNASTSFWLVCRALVVGQFANIGLPLRIGDLARIVSLSGDTGESKVTLTATVVVERWLDAAVLGCSLIALLPFLVLPQWFTWWEGPGAIVVGLGLVAFVLLASGRRQVARLARGVAGIAPSWLAPTLRRFVGGFHVLADQRAIGLVWGLSLATWAVSIAINALVALALGLSLPLSAPVFVLLVVTFGASIPSAPLRIGSFEYLCILALAEFGVAPTTALSYGLLLHVVAFVWPIVLGGALLAWPTAAALVAARARARQSP